MPKNRISESSRLDDPIETLELKPILTKALRSVGITTIGELLTVLRRGWDATAYSHTLFVGSNRDEMRAKLIEKGFIREPLLCSYPPPTTFYSLRKTGITAAGDILDRLNRDPGALDKIREFGELSLEELVNRMKAEGWLPQE